MVDTSVALKVILIVVAQLCLPDEDERAFGAVYSRIYSLFES